MQVERPHCTRTVCWVVGPNSEQRHASRLQCRWERGCAQEFVAGGMHWKRSWNKGLGDVRAIGAVRVSFGAPCVCSISVVRENSGGHAASARRVELLASMCAHGKCRLGLPEEVGAGSTRAAADVRSSLHRKGLQADSIEDGYLSAVRRPATDETRGGHWAAAQLCGRRHAGAGGHARRTPMC